MQELSLFYFGQDESFRQLLTPVAEELKISLKTFFTPNFSDLSLDVAHLILLDECFCEFYQEIRARASALVILVLSEPNPAIPEGIDDILLKNLPPQLLKHRLGFYREILRTPQGRGTGNLARKNHDLNRQIALLHKQLSRIDTDLHIQNEVLAKINQISQLSRQINCLDSEQIATVCIELIPRLIAARFASLYSFDPDNNVLHLLRHNHPYMIDRMVVLEQHPRSPMSHAIVEKKILLIRDFQEWSDKGDKIITRLFNRNYQTNSCLIAPLQSSGNILGILNFADKIGAESFDATTDLPPVQLLCEIIGSALSNIKLYEEVKKQARTDGMTGLVNHRTFYDELDKEINRSRRYGNLLSLIMIDLDDLKHVNDQFGHRAGDAVLMHVADQIRSCIRETDIPARYGGDEFAIILPNTSLSDAMIVAQRLLDQVSAEPLRIGKRRHRVTVSIGLGQYRPDYSIEDFMNQTDGALFEAKTTGKGRIHIFEYNPH